MDVSKTGKATVTDFYDENTPQVKNGNPLLLQTQPKKGPGWRRLLWKRPQISGNRCQAFPNSSFTFILNRGQSNDEEATNVTTQAIAS